MKAWLIVLNWNGKEDTLELLGSLARAETPDTTVLVVDNGSTDGTMAAVADEHPWVEILQTGANLGYAGGNNRGIQQALNAGADVIGVLNNDTLVDPDFWLPLVQSALGGLVAVSPDIRYADRPGVSWFYGGAVDARRALPCHLQPDEQPSRNAATPSDLLTGCCLVASAEVWRRVGLFDESMFLIFEDSDWSMRARAVGCDLLLVPGSVIRHKVSRSIDAGGASVGLFYFCRNGMTFARRWLGMRGAWTFFMRIVLPAAKRRRSLVPLMAAGSFAWRHSGPAPQIVCHLR